MLTYYAESHSATHTRNITDNIKLYLKNTGESDFTKHGLVAFKNSLMKNNEYKLSVVRGFIRQMRYLGLADCLDDSIFKLVEKWRLQGNDKGIAVLSLDPVHGPFSDIEFEAIGHTAAHRYAENSKATATTLSTEAYAIILLFKASGRRPEQIALLKVKDFSYTNKLTGYPVYVGNIPRIKQRGKKARSVFKPFGFVKSVAQIIELHIEGVIAEAEKEIGRSLNKAESGEFPLFASPNAFMDMRQYSDEQLLDYLKSVDSQIASDGLRRALVNAVGVLGIISERTGEPLHVTPYRFRYTLGTRAAQEGAGELTIATLLDHSDIQNVGCYVKNIPEYAVEISKIMNQPLARYAAAFAGLLVKDEDEANQENQGAARIPCHEKECDVGSCGSNAFCQDYAPVACYLCPKFRPWADAPHHLILEWLLEERERLKSNTADMRIASINDRAILAVCQVIKLVEEYKKNG